jgi:hypothetical protein
MPIPSKKDNEKQADYMGRCMDFMKDEKYPQKQKVAICLNTFSQPKKKAKANEIEVDFSEDIKKMNKAKETKVEEVTKIEAKPEEASNTAVTAPPEVKVDQA